MIAVALLLLTLAAGVGLLYWLVIVTEGAYLGSGAVAFLYDRGAASYDRVKQFDSVDDARRLALPLVRALRGVKRPMVLDVATGTGRLPQTLLRNLEFEGTIVGLDVSMGMLREAKRKTARYHGRVYWLWKDAMDLPFANDSFDAVTCLEAIEFMRDPVGVVKEMTRVLRPGGTLLATNRIGLDGLLMPGRAFSKATLEARLADLPFVSLETKQWQAYYDLVWARKEGCLATGARPREIEQVLWCPRCHGSPLSMGSTRVACESCGSQYPVKDDIIWLQTPHVEEPSRRWRR